MSLRQHSRMKIDVAKLADRESNEDFRKLVWRLVGDLKGLEPVGVEVVVATYVSSRKTSGGVYLPDKSVDEDRWQGKVGLILKMGDIAFKYYQGAYPWEGRKPEVDDYVMFVPDSSQTEFGWYGNSLRVLRDYQCRLIVTDPKAIY